ncbi:NAD(P)-dependent oxidoreductase [Streptomyces parvulus]|uniref:NAD(P)-dependent oxidoreductase n=1 Tax=Streptomyces parvulus TaxID=146923 RepID=UPI0038043C1F
MSSSFKLQTVAVLGAGTMASAMICRLRDAGFRLHLYNRSHDRIAPLAQAQDVIAATPAEAAADADLVLSVVADDEASRTMWMGPTGALAGLRAGRLAMECSTLSHRWARAWAQEVRSHGSHPFDAPVTGSRPRAQEGTLVMFLGADPGTVQRVAPVTDALTERIYHLGPPGAATQFKLAHNLLAASILSAFAETLDIIARMDLSPALAVEILSSYGWATGVASGKGSAMVVDQHDDVLCKLSLLAKDTEYALAAAEDVGALPSVGIAASGSLQQAVAAGLGDLDMSAVHRIYQGMAKEEL